MCELCLLFTPYTICRDPVLADVWCSMGTRVTSCSLLNYTRCVPTSSSLFVHVVYGVSCMCVCVLAFVSGVTIKHITPSSILL